MKSVMHLTQQHEPLKK